MQRLMADDAPVAVQEHQPGDSATEISCPFCHIVSAYQPIPVSDTTSTAWDPEHLSPSTYVLFSTDHVVAFLDIAPLTRGHVLVSPRKHRVRVGDLKPEEAASIGRVLPLIARAVLAATYPDIPQQEADYNVVQNNGPGAAQVIPHVHFHIIPRPPLNYTPPDPVVSKKQKRYPPARIPTGLQASYIQFGRGQRNELDDDDAAVLVVKMREQIKQEWQREFGSNTDQVLPRPQKL